MQVDHVIARYNGGSDDLSNLLPACPSCNNYKHSMDLERFRQFMKEIHKRIHNNITTVRIAERYGVVKVEPFDGVFYFEKPHGKR